MKKLHLKQPAFWAAFFSFPLFVITHVGATAIANRLAGWQEQAELMIAGHFMICKKQPYDFAWPSMAQLTVFALSVVLPFLVIAILWKRYHRYKWAEFLSIILIADLCQYLFFAVFETADMLHLDPFRWMVNLPFSASFFSANYIFGMSYGLTRSMVIIPAFIGIAAFWLLLYRTASLKNSYPALIGLLCGLAVELPFFLLFSRFFMR